MLDLDAYLARIGWTGPRTPTLEVLSGLMRAHVQAIAFENLDILLGRPIQLELDALQAKLVTARRGGYCFEQNGLFSAVLRGLGFQVTTLAGRVRLGVPAEVPTARTHMVLRIDLPGADCPYLADVGFGFSPTGALRLEADLEQPLELDRYRLLRAPSTWTLQLHQPEGWSDAYVFHDDAYTPIDYEVANHFTSTHPRSHFRLGPLVIRPDLAARAPRPARQRADHTRPRRRGHRPAQHRRPRRAAVRAERILRAALPRRDALRCPGAPDDPGAAALSYWQVARFCVR